MGGFGADFGSSFSARVALKNGQNRRPRIEKNRRELGQSKEHLEREAYARSRCRYVSSIFPTLLKFPRHCSCLRWTVKLMKVQSDEWWN